MMQVVKIETPLDAAVVRSLRAGMEVEISGVVYSARDMAHKRLCELIEAGRPLPFELAGQVIYFVGPTPARPGRVIGAAGPTTAARMDAFSPILMRAGVRGTIGKGYRDTAVRRALKEFGAVHFSAAGGAGAMLSRHITAAEVVAYEDLGAEAIRRLTLRDFPAIVAYDAYGASVYAGEPAA